MNAVVFLSVHIFTGVLVSKCKENDQSEKNATTDERGYDKKKEEEEVKDIQLLHRVNTTAGNNNKITKPKPPKNKNSLLCSQEIKIEQDIDIKPTLETPANNLRHEPPVGSQEQINRFIDYVFNQNISVTKASCRLNMYSDKASYCYHMFMNDPEKKIPLLEAPASRRVNTQEEVNTFIRLIVNDKMPVMEAAVKANMTCNTARYYYRRYLMDPNHKIPSPCARIQYSQEKVDELIGYLVDKSMALKAASEKANVSKTAARRHFRKYLDENNLSAPEPPRLIITPDKAQELIGYIVDKNMTIKAASAKANMCISTGKKYYKQYLIKNKLITRRNVNVYTQENVDNLISLIVDDKMTIEDASKKMKIGYSTGKKYYQKYVKDQQQNRPNWGGCDGGVSNNEMDPVKTNEQPGHQILDSSTPKNLQCTRDQIKELISCIVDQKQPLDVASKKTNMSNTTARKYHLLYLNDQNHAIPTSTYVPTIQPCSQDKIQRLYNYIFDDKMSITAASLKAGMSASSAIKYYKKFINDHKVAEPPHIIRILPHPREKIQELIHYLVDEKMSLTAASKKAKMSRDCSRTHYQRYLRDQKNTASRTPKDSCTFRPCTQEIINHSTQYTQNQISTLIHSIINEKITIKAAAVKANIGYSNATRYYRQYRNGTSN